MFRILCVFMIFAVSLFGLSVSSDDKYKVFTSKKYHIVYTNDYKNEAKFIKENIDEYFKINDKSFGYSFDEPIKIVLVSNNIQIANAFSTQVPLNMQVLYNGGSSKNDYFSNKSWLITLFTHEMVHNYQTNAKKSKISKTLKKYLGNNYMPVWASVVPLFTLPNLLLPTAFLEGNAVLNESIYQNGGRLYSGSLNALKNSLVLSNKITPTTFINDTLDFPYTTQKYIVGGFYMQYLANKYSLEKVNRFFYENSIHSINPLLLNTTFINHFGTTFEKSVNDFVEYTQSKYQNYKELNSSKKLARSKSQIYLSKQNDKIYFITSDLKTKKELHTFDINTHNTNIYDTTLQNGKVFNIEGKLYSSGSWFVSSTKYKQGLFDEYNYILENTQGKAINDIYQNKQAYINIKKSSLDTKLYVDGSYYADVSSSSLFDKDGSIYYFKQIKHQRVLYKNKKELFRFDGYFSNLVDIVDDSVYFIANTKTGSSLYKLKENKLFSLVSADNIIDSKIIDDKNALLVSVDADGYMVQNALIKEKKVKNIFYSKNDAELKDFKFKTKFNNKSLESKNYNELKELEFSMLYPSYTYDSEKKDTYMFTALFADPVMFNMLNIYAYQDSDETITGLRYINERYIPFAINLYNNKKDIQLSNDRTYGGSVKIYAPIVKKGNHLLEASIQQYIDDDNKDKNPTVFSLSHLYQQNLSLESSAYFLNSVELLLKKDRGDTISGFDYNINKHITHELYINAQVKALSSDVSVLKEQRAIKVVNDYLDKDDETNMFIEGLDYDGYVKEITKTSIGFSKVFNFSSYYSKFPLSLQKESLFYNYAKYDIKSLGEFEIIEQIAGMKFDLLFFHKLPIPVTVKYIKNDFSKDDYKVKVELGVRF